MANQNRRKEKRKVEFVGEKTEGKWEGTEIVWNLCVCPVKESKMRLVALGKNQQFPFFSLLKKIPKLHIRLCLLGENKRSWLWSCHCDV